MKKTRFQTTLSCVSFLGKLVLIFLFVFPFLWMLSVSLQTSEETMTFPATIIPRHFMVSNYVDAWTSRPFLLFLRNSVIVVAAILVIQLAVMIPAAYGFAKYSFKGKSLLFALVIIAFMTPGQITFLPVYMMMSRWKLLGTLVPQILPFMTSAFGVFLLRQYFMQVPTELIEAAKLDGASEVQMLWHVLMPMSKPAISTIILFNFIAHWNDYFWPLVMTNRDAVRPLTLAVKSLYDSEGITNWNIVMAGNMFLVFPILLIYAVSNRHIISAFAYTGIK